MLHRTIQEDDFLRLLYVVDGVGVRHYEPSGSLFRAGDEVSISRETGGLRLEGYGMREVWRQFTPGAEEKAA